MKTIIKYLSVLTGILFCLSSCDKNLIETPIDNQLSGKIEKTHHFVYQGRDYYYQQATDGKIEENESLNIIKSLQENPNVAIFLHPDSTVEYFDSYGELEKRFESKTTTRASNLMYTYSLTVKLYEDDKYKGKSVEYLMNSWNTPSRIINLSSDWKNKISSLKMSTTVSSSVGEDYYVITLCNGLNLKGSTISFCTSNTKKENSIKVLNDYALFNLSKEKWNDKAQSIRLWQTRSLLEVETSSHQ